MNNMVSLKFQLHPDRTDFAVNNPRLVLGQEVCEDPDAVKEAQMLGVEAETHLKLPGIEDVIDFFIGPVPEANHPGGVNTGAEPLPDQATCVKIQRDTLGLLFAQIVVE